MQTHPVDLYHSHLQYQGNACFHCGEWATQKPLQKCSRCKRVSYCGSICQQADFSVHKNWCSPWATTSLLRAERLDKRFYEDTEALDEVVPAGPISSARRKAWSAIVGQDLPAWQDAVERRGKMLGEVGRTMLYFAPRCLRCLKPAGGEVKLRWCEKCQRSVGWCSEACESSDRERHTTAKPGGLLGDWTECQGLLAKAADDLVKVKVTRDPTAPDSTFSPDRVLDKPLSPFPAAWNAYAATLEGEQRMYMEGQLRRVLVTPPLSMPLVVISALDRLLPGGLARYAKATGPKTLRLHIIGAGPSVEIKEAFSVFEELLHVLPSVQTLHYSLIGPDMAVQETAELSLECCPSCRRRNRERIVQCIGKPYEQLPSSTPSPDFIIAYNSSAHESAWSWTPALQKIIKTGVPFVMTSLNRFEAVGDAEVLEKAARKLGETLSFAWRAQVCPFGTEHLSFDYFMESNDAFYSASAWWLGVRGRS